MFSKSCSVQKVLAIKLDNRREVGERLISYKIECTPPGDDVMTDFVIFTAGEGRKGASYRDQAKTRIKLSTVLGAVSSRPA